MLKRKFSGELTGRGTGMIIDPQGHILTNNHYVRRIHGNSRIGVNPTVFGGMIRVAKPHGIIYCSICLDYFSTDVGNNWGNSGAILLNRHGEVIGVDVAIVTQFDW